MPLEHSNSYELENPVKKTGSSESKEYKNPSDNLNEINQREKIDNLLEKSKLLSTEKEKVIDYIIKKYDNDNYESIINQIIEGECETLDDIISLLSLNSNVQEVQSNNQGKENNVQEVQSNVHVETKGMEQKYEIVKSILKTIDGENSKDYSKILQALNEGKNFKEIIPMLKDNPIALRGLSLDLQKQNPEQYKIFRSTLENIDKDFIPLFEKMDLGKVDFEAKLKLGTDNLNGVDLSSHILRQEKDGAVIEAGKNSRNLSLVGSDYKLDSKLQNNNQKNAIQEVETNLKNDLKPINEVLNTVSSVLDYLDKAISNNTELKDVKENIKNTNISLYTELNIENINSISDIKNTFVGLQKQKEKEKEDKIKEAKAIIDLFIKQNADIAKEQDEKKKEVLKFLSSIGFDRIPQSITEQLVRELKANVFNLGELNLNLKTIDLANGRFGETDTEAGGTKWKQNLVKFMEKLVYGEIGTPESIFASNSDKFTGVFGATLNPTEVNSTFEKSGIKVGTGWNIVKMRENLGKTKN
ncbi:MAG: hypothetical protein PHV23_05955 [Candidatus Gracilibacteria bacterium]|nr:hypothetical protein [Candidatus Gracilibacteria bacterium]